MAAKNAVLRRGWKGELANYRCIPISLIVHNHMILVNSLRQVDKVVIVPSNTESYSVLVEDDTLQTGFAFVMFESEAVADKALAASHDFPWPVR